jgi:WD40 repeat protein
MELLWEEQVSHRPTALAFGPDAAELLCAWGDSGELNCLDLRAARWRWRVPLPTTQITALSHNNRDVIAAGGRSGSFALVALSSGAIIGTLRGHESNVQDVEFLGGRDELVSTGNGGDVRLWSLSTSSRVDKFKGFWAPAGGGRVVCLSARGERLAATSSLDQAQIIDLANPLRPAGLSAVAAPIGFSTDSTALWVLTNGGVIERRPVEGSGVPPAQVALPFKGIISAASASTDVIACLDDRSQLIFVDTPTRSLSPLIDAGHGYPWWAAVSSEGRLAATGGRDQTVRLWEITSAKNTASWKSIGPAVNGAFSPDGQMLALVFSTGVAEILPLGGQPKPPRIVTSSGNLQGVAFHPSEPRLFLGGRDGVVHVIDTTIWVEIAQLRAMEYGRRPATVTRIAVAGDGSALAAYGESGTIHVWRKTAP